MASNGRLVKHCAGDQATRYRDGSVRTEFGVCTKAAIAEYYKDPTIASAPTATPTPPAMPIVSTVIMKGVSPGQFDAGAQRAVKGVVAAAVASAGDACGMSSDRACTEDDVTLSVTEVRRESSSSTEVFYRLFVYSESSFTGVKTALTEKLTPPLFLAALQGQSSPPGDSLPKHMHRETVLRPTHTHIEWLFCARHQYVHA